MSTEQRTLKARSFVAEMPAPLPDESLLGYVNRALQRTLVRNLRQGLRLAGVELPQGFPPNASKLDDSAVAGIAELFKLDPAEVATRRYRRKHSSSATIDYFGIELRTQYWEPSIRRVSPRALAKAPYHRAIWELRPFCFDPGTRERLLDKCPVCGHRLGWSSLRGPANCDVCIDEKGYATTDLRDHPQPLVDIHDDEAIDFVVGLVHPDPNRRNAAQRLVPEGIRQTGRTALFEAVMYLACCQRPEYVLKATDIARPQRAADFVDLSPAMLERAGRAIIGGEEGFGALCDEMRRFADRRPHTHGIYHELGPLAAASLDPRLSTRIQVFFNDAIARDLARTNDTGTVRRRVGRLDTCDNDRIWRNIDEITKELAISKHALTRLANSGAVETRRADAKISPVMMRVDDVKPLAAIYKDVVNVRGATAILRVQPPVLEQLAIRELIMGIDGAVADMFDDRGYRLSTVNALHIAIKQRARPGPPPRSAVKLMEAVRALRTDVPWAAIIDGIVCGAIPAYAISKFGRDWRRAVAVELNSLPEAADHRRQTHANRWLTRDEAAQILGTDETTVWALAKNGLLPKRTGDGTAMFARLDVEAAANRYVFGSEMRQRSVFRIGHELNRWLKTQDVHPEFTLRDGRMPVYLREKFEAALPLQPKSFAEIVVPQREQRRVDSSEKKHAVKAVISGLTPHHVAVRMGVHHKTVARWVKHYEETGEIATAGKLDPFADEIVALVAEDSSRSTNDIWKRFNSSQQMSVAYKTFSAFLTQLGISRDKATNRLHRSR
ncbi:conserved hypothetical protein [Nitrobacter hamburgensis X14]|uniref:Helix-turn-helix domain-containing protein n=1 Tax=Nitrobacter hamburgensis (strain DSM 10229 / NCIMB 13809 / X14) TaxID=323097 RepID=Q1QNK7_NITHX|nr:helix-turn-helix domain-containing protein [Nitrobacter hamburgensis]ABE62190.1 conserved hypothetical protein [Nitrobacter hamburgensis X14]